MGWFASHGTSPRTHFHFFSGCSDSLHPCQYLDIGATNLISPPHLSSEGFCLLFPIGGKVHGVLCSCDRSICCLQLRWCSPVSFAGLLPMRYSSLGGIGAANRCASTGAVNHEPVSWISAVVCWGFHLENKNKKVLVSFASSASVLSSGCRVRVMFMSDLPVTAWYVCIPDVLLMRVLWAMTGVPLMPPVLPLLSLTPQPVATVPSGLTRSGWLADPVICTSS